jgi:hypothetical protein
VHANLAALEIDLLALPFDDADLQVDDTVFTERFDGRTGLRVELDETISGRDVHDALVATTVGPVRHAPTRQLARRHGGTLTFAHAVHPDHLAGLAVERDHVAPRAGSRVEHTPNRQRCAFELVLGKGSEIIGLEAPRHLELVEVRCGDLVERRVLGASNVRRVVEPVPIFRRWEPGRLSLESDDREDERRENATG